MQQYDTKVITINWNTEKRSKVSLYIFPLSAFEGNGTKNHGIAKGVTVYSLWLSLSIVPDVGVSHYRDAIVALANLLPPIIFLPFTNLQQA